MANATENVVHGQMGYIRVAENAEAFGVPRETLFKRVIKYRGNANRDLAVKKKMGPYTKVFTKDGGTKLADYEKSISHSI